MKALYRLLYYLSILLTSILAGFTLAGAFAGDASPGGFKLMPFIGLVLPMLLLANVVSAIYWTVRWRCWVFIPLIAILGNLGYLTRVLQSPLFDSASQPNTESLKKNERATESALTIATYNVNSFNHEHTGFSCKEIAAYMKELGVDIFCFQEFGINHEFGTDSLRTVLSEWPYYYVPSSPAGESLLQLAVFSRYPIKEKQLVTYPNSNNCSLWCDIDITAKQSVCSTIICRLRKSAATSANWKKNFVQTIPTVRNVPLSPLPMVCTRTSRNVPHKLNISIN